MSNAILCQATYLMKNFLIIFAFLDDGQWIKQIQNEFCINLTGQIDILDERELEVFLLHNIVIQIYKFNFLLED